MSGRDSDMIHRLAVLLVSVAMIVLCAAPVAADTMGRPAFCSSDPIFDVDGHAVNVVVELSPYKVKDQITENRPVRTVLAHPEGTAARLVWVGGDFPEVARTREGSRENEAGVSVQVPHVKGLEAVRVTVYIDGALVAQVETSQPHAALSFAWADGPR
jgi:hypothetical protein